MSEPTAWVVFRQNKTVATEQLRDGERRSPWELGWEKWENVVEAESAEAACEYLATAQRWEHDVRMVALPFDAVVHVWVKPERAYSVNRTGNIAKVAS